MVYVAGGRGRGGPRGRGPGVGGVAFQSTHSNDGNRYGGVNPQTAHAHDQRQSYGGHDPDRGPKTDDSRSHQPAESLRITVGNDQYKDRKHQEHGADRVNPSVGHRLGPPVDSMSREEDDRLYRQEKAAYGHSGRGRSPYSDKSGDTNRSDMYARRDSSYDRDYNRSSGHGNQDASYSRMEEARPSVPNVSGSALFPAGAKPLGAGAPIYQGPSADSPAPAEKPTSTPSRPLKSILKRKPDPIPEKSPEKPAGLPGIANYMDIDDEEKFLYGDDERRVDEPSDRSGASQDNYMPQTNIRSAMQSWQPAATEKTVSSVMSQFANNQSNVGSATPHQGYNTGHSQYVPSQAPPAQVSQPTPAGNEGGDIWNLLAKSVQTAQELGGKGQVAEFAPQNQQTIPTQQSPIQPPSATPYDPTIENILKSIGFDFDKSKRNQEKAKLKPEEQFDVNQMSSFLGGGMSHEEMKSKLLEKGKAGAERLIREAQESLAKDLKEMQTDNEDRKSDARKEEPLPQSYSGAHEERNDAVKRDVKEWRDMEYDQETREHVARGRNYDEKTKDSVARDGEYDHKTRDHFSRDRDYDQKTRDHVATDVSDVRDRLDNNNKLTHKQNNSDDEYYDRNSRKDAKSRVLASGRERRDSWDASTYSLQLPLEKIAKPTSSITKFERDLSPVSDDDSSPPPMFNLPPITIKRRTSLEHNTGPGWDRPRSRSRTPSGSFGSKDRHKSRSPSWNTSTKGERSPVRKRSRSPVITRVFNLSPRDTSPLRSRVRSEVNRGRSSSPRRRNSPRSRHSHSPHRRSKSPRRRSKSPRKRSRSPRKRSISPRRRSRSPRRKRSVSPRGRKRSFSPNDSRDRKIIRRDNREKRRSRSRSRQGRRSRSGGKLSVSPHRRGMSRSPRNVSVSSSGSDTDRKSYFSAPLHGPPKPIPPRYYNPPDPNTSTYGPPPDHNASTYGPPPNHNASTYGPPPAMPPVDMYGYPVAPPPVLPAFVMPTGPPPMSFPPPGYGPPGPPISVPYSMPPPGAPPLSVEPAPPGTFPQIPLNLPMAAHAQIPVHALDKRQEDDKRVEHRIDKSENSDVGSERIVKISGKPRAKAESVKKSTISRKEKEQLQKDIDERRSKIQALDIELDNLKKQQNEQMRKKQKEKDGHKDPILIENSMLQEAITAEIGKLRQQQNVDSELLKEEEVPVTRTIKLKDTSPKTTERDDRRKKPASSDSKPKATSERQMMKYSFVDKGDHWCKGCKAVYNNIHEYIEHLSTYKHKQTQSLDVRPWRDGMEPYEGKIVNKKGIQVSLPGVEFLVPTQAYYCTLCKTFMGDVSCGIDHFRCESHYFNYQKYVKDNKYYEKKKLLEKQVGLSEINRSNRALNKKDVKRDSDSPHEKEVDTHLDSSVDGRRTTDSSNKSGNSDNRKPVDKKAGFGKFTWVKPDEDETDEKADEQAEKTDPDTSTKSDESKKGGINIHLSGKTIPKAGGFTKQNPLLPPWQPVGKKNEPFHLRKTKHESEDTSNLDMFITSSGGKVPVALDKTDKKKITAKEILEAFSGKFKDKDIQPKTKSIDDDDSNERRRRSIYGERNRTSGETVTSSKEAVTGTSIFKEKSPPVSKPDATVAGKAAVAAAKEEIKVSSSKKDNLGSIPLPTAHLDTPKYTNRNRTNDSKSDSRNASSTTSTQSKDCGNSKWEFDSIPLPSPSKAPNPDSKAKMSAKNDPSDSHSDKYDSAKTKESGKLTTVSNKSTINKDIDATNSETNQRPRQTATRGRGRGRGRGVFTESRSTRQTRSMAPSDSATSVEPSNPNTKSVKKVESPIKSRRRTTSGSAAEKKAAGKEADLDDGASDVSDFSEISMEMGSDFEVVDDIDDTDED